MPLHTQRQEEAQIRKYNYKKELKLELTLPRDVFGDVPSSVVYNRAMKTKQNKKQDTTTKCTAINITFYFKIINLNMIHSHINIYILCTIKQDTINLNVLIYNYNLLLFLKREGGLQTNICNMNLLIQKIESHVNKYVSLDTHRKIHSPAY